MIWTASRVTQLVIYLALAVIGALWLPSDLGVGMPSMLTVLADQMPLLLSGMAVCAAGMATYALWKR